MFEEDLTTTLIKGDDHTLEFRYLYNSTPVDLTGSQVFFESDEATLNTEAEIPNPISGQILVKIPKELTKDLTRSKVKYELVFWIDGVGGDKKTIMQSSIKFKEEIYK